MKCSCFWCDMIWWSHQAKKGFQTCAKCAKTRPTVLSTSLWKIFFFAWRFILNETILFWLTISCQKPFVFSISVFCSQIFILKINLRPSIGVTYAISRKLIFCRRQYFFFFYYSLLKLNYWCFTTTIWKFSEKKIWIGGTCWKSASRLPTLQISA